MNETTLSLTTRIAVNYSERSGRLLLTPEGAEAALASLTGNIDRGAWAFVVDAVRESGESVTLGELADRVITANAQGNAAKKNKTTACDCGHECLSILAMSASRGTACPQCYDRMSN